MAVLDQIAENQQDKEVTANENFEAVQTSAIFGRHASDTSALTWAYYGGSFLASDGSIVNVASDDLTLAPSTTNYIEANPATGAVTVNQVGFTVGRIPLYQIVTGPATVTSYTDKRVFSMQAALAATGYYIVPSAWNGTIPAYTYVFRHVVPGGITWTLPAHFVESLAYLKSAPSASMVFSITKNGVEIGTLNFSTGSPNNFGSFTVAATAILQGGDVLEIFLNQSGTDATAADLAVSLKGTRS